MSETPLFQVSDKPDGAPIQVLLTKPGAVQGTEAQRQEIADKLPKPEPGKHWEYQPMAAMPLRFASMEDGDKFLAALEAGKAVDDFFIAPTRYDEIRRKWVINLKWGNAVAELAVFVQKDDAKPLAEWTILECQNKLQPYVFGDRLFFPLEGVEKPYISYISRSVPALKARDFKEADEGRDLWDKPDEMNQVIGDQSELMDLLALDRELVASWKIKDKHGLEESK